MKKSVKKLWIMFWQDTQYILHWYPLHKKSYYKGEKQTRKDCGGHTFTLVKVKFAR